MTTDKNIYLHTEDKIFKSLIVLLLLREAAKKLFKNKLEDKNPQHYFSDEENVTYSEVKQGKKITGNYPAYIPTQKISILFFPFHFSQKQNSFIFQIEAVLKIVLMGVINYFNSYLLLLF